MEFLEVWIHAPDLSGHELICRVPAPQQETIYNVVRGYEKAHTALTDTGFSVADLTSNNVLRWWGTGDITVTNETTRERFNYVEVQGGYGLEPLGGRE